MEDYGKVSIWIGNVSDKQELDIYLKETFDDEGDSTSHFMTDFEIDYIDNQFQEVDFNSKNESLLKKLEGVSYLKSYANQLPEITNLFNVIICLYNFKYCGTVNKSNNISFIGCFDFEED
jgi:hypothetical protein